MVGEDPMGSDPSSFYDAPKRSKLSLNNFDKNFFPLLVREGIDTVSSNHCLVDPLQSWYSFVLECAIRAGAVLFDGQ